MKKTLFIAAILFSTVQLMAQDVLSISGETISLNEFENTLMKNTNVISNRANIIWNYDAHEHIESELRKL